MNSSQQHHDPVAEEQAALWAARLDGDTLDREQRAELDAWLAEAPSHRALLSRYCQFSADLEEQLPALVAAGAVRMPEAKAPARRGWSFPRFAGITLAAAAAVAVTFVVTRPAPSVQSVAVAPAQRGSATLADGTRVELNANTSFRFENNKTERLVWLAGGEALFMVAKDPARPFIVKTPTGSVQVTGTTFNVRSAQSVSAFEVTVVEGSVTVRPATTDGSLPAPIPLTASEQFSARGNAGAKKALSQNDLEDALAWRTGVLVFRGLPLREAAERFAHYHGKSIRVADSVASEPVGGTHKIEDLRGFYSALELMLPGVKVSPDDGSGVAVISSRPGS